MAWSKTDLKMFAAGLAIGGKWQGGGDGGTSDTTNTNEIITGKPIHVKNAAGNDFDFAFIDDYFTGKVVHFKNVEGSEFHSALIDNYIQGNIMEVEE